VPILFWTQGQMSQGGCGKVGRGTRCCGGFWQFEDRSTPYPPSLRFPERTGAALGLGPAHDSYQHANLLFRLRQLGNNCGKFIEYLVPALHLTPILRALHGFISNEGEFRLAVSEVLEDGHVVRTLYGLMFYS
jgi:hypothetical protein